MKSLRLGIYLGLLLASLLWTGCIKYPLETDTAASSPSAGDVVPFIQYPDVYRASQGFGFNLPEGWSAAWLEQNQLIEFTRSPFQLTLYYDGVHSSTRTILTATGTFAGTIAIDGFWSDTTMQKYRLTDPAEASTLVVYFAREPLNGIWLTAYLECLGDGCEGGIPADIEAQVDGLLTSYEEHGWEE